jgi:hypothetical protein
VAGPGGVGIRLSGGRRKVVGPIVAFLSFSDAFSSSPGRGQTYHQVDLRWEANFRADHWWSRRQVLNADRISAAISEREAVLWACNRQPFINASQLRFGCWAAPISLLRPRTCRRVCAGAGGLRWCHQGLARYFSEIARVGRPGAKLLSAWYLHDSQLPLAAGTRRQFPVDRGIYALASEAQHLARPACRVGALSADRLRLRG